MPMKWTPELRKKYRQPEGRMCACGQPAARYSNGGPVCAKCDEIEDRMYRRPGSRNAFIERRREITSVWMPHYYALHLPHGHTA